MCSTKQKVSLEIWNTKHTVLYMGIPEPNTFSVPILQNVTWYHISHTILDKINKLHLPHGLSYLQPTTQNFLTPSNRVIQNNFLSTRSLEQYIIGQNKMDKNEWIKWIK